MAKIILDNIDIQLSLIKKDGEWIVTLSAHYGVGASEYNEFSTRKGMPVVLTEAQEDTIINFAKNVVYPQMLANEGI
uniref:Uncharacterized protein n=1 Tax=viral metagenome TaxID=1070528 RepID=A0A6M3JQF1_9ZZZZ